MRYAYHFEFCERPEMPEWFRGDLFLTLGWVQKYFGLSGIFQTCLPKILDQLKPKRLIELGAGGGDGLALLAPLTTLSLLATDKYPQVNIWQDRLVGFKNLTWSSAAVGFDDFAEVLGPRCTQGSVLLLTAAFHHIADCDAPGFLKRAALAGCHILVVEPLPRTWFGALLGALTGIAALMYPLFARKISVGRRLRLLAFHWLIPLIPLTLSHDGVVSAFRQRTKTDWMRLTQGLPIEVDEIKNLGVFKSYSVTLLKVHHPGLGSF